jgi:hypothetical protein
VTTFIHALKVWEINKKAAVQRPFCLAKKRRVKGMQSRIPARTEGNTTNATDICSGASCLLLADQNYNPHQAIRNKEVVGVEASATSSFFYTLYQPLCKVFPLQDPYHPMFFQIIENSHEKRGDIPSPSGRGCGQRRNT